MEHALPYICAALAAFLTTLVLTPLAKRVARALDAVDYPSKRRINTVPIPRLGGTAVFAGVGAGYLLMIWGTKALGWPSALIPHPTMTVNYVMLAASFTVIMLTGAVDDVVSLKPAAKLAGQAAAAAATSSR